MSTIDRVRFYDGEFLRAFDFSDEQTYHVEMRRRLNRYLHLYGIVQGLQLNADTEGTVTQVSILPGMAIDAFGREIYVFAPYPFGDADITTNRISSAGNYDVWLCYRKTPGTPPSSGYAACNQTNQYTRWVEGYSVVLLQSPSNPFTLPAFSDDDTDDSTQNQAGVLLGTMYIDPTSVTSEFSNPLFHHRHFFGTIAQRIHTPPGYDAMTAGPPFAPFSIFSKQTPHNPPVSLDIEPNVFARKNLVLGPDFDMTAITLSKIQPSTTTNTGTAKLAGDLFVKGNIYSNTTDPVTGNPVWLGLSSYVQQLVQQFLPEVVVASPFPVSVSLDATAKYSGSYLTDTAVIPVSTTRLKSVGPSIVFASFSQVETTDQADFNTLFGAGAVQLSIMAPPTVNFIGQNGQVSVPWLAGPASGAAAPFKSAIDNFTLSCVVLCFPPP